MAQTLLRPLKRSCLVITSALTALVATVASASNVVDLLNDIPIEEESTVVELREANAEAFVSEEDIWEVVRAGWGLAALPDSVVTKELKLYTRSLPYTHQTTERSRTYLYYILSETQKRGMPSEIALLPFIESAFQPEALSRSKAAGLWQFLPSTGDIFDLRQSSWRDDRLDIIESTNAALDYLQKLYEQFGNWHLALAAYNCGEGTLRRLIQHNVARGKNNDFMSLNLPQETRRYVPKLLAVKRLIDTPQAFGLSLPAIANEPYFVRVNKERDLDIETAAQLAETDIDEFRRLNPSYSRPVIVGAHQRSVLIPAAKLDAFIMNTVAWQASGKPLSNWSTYQMKPKDTLDGIARRYHMTVADLRAANKIPKNRKVLPGSTLLVKDHTQEADISSSAAQNQMKLNPLPTRRTVYYRVRSGDTLSKIAKRFGVRTRDIAKLNRIKANRIKAGQRLRIVVQRTPRVRTRNITYRVRAGDSLFSIAKKYNVPVSAITDANDLNGHALSVGQKITIPH